MPVQRPKTPISHTFYVHGVNQAGKDAATLMRNGWQIIEVYEVDHRTHLMAIDSVKQIEIDWNDT